MAPATQADRTGRLQPPALLTVSHNECNSQAKRHEASNKSHEHIHDGHGHGHDYGSDKKPTPSFAERAAELAHTPTPLLVQGDHNLRDIYRGAPGDPPQLRSRRRSWLALGASTDGSGSGSGGGKGGGGGRGGGVQPTDNTDRHALARQRSQYFEDVFSARDANMSPAEERVRSEALILAELRTNVLIGDEFTVVTELSVHLAVRYRRPLSSVVVSLQHNACLCFGGSFDPAYVLAIFALPAELQPTTNKRNAALLQRHLEDSLGVSPARGFLRFAPVSKDNMAYGGTTATGHMDELAKNTVAASNTVADPPDSTRRNRAARRLSIKSRSSVRSASSLHSSSPTTEEEPRLPSIVEQVHSPRGSLRDKRREQREKERSGGHGLPEPEASKKNKENKGNNGNKGTSIETVRRARRTKSFVATLFGRSSL